MTFSDFTTKNTILARYPISQIVAGKAIVDVNNNNKLDHHPETGVITEPALDASLTQIKEFARLNGTGSVLTKECLGEMRTLLGTVKDSQVSFSEAGPDLTAVAKSLNPFKGRSDAGAASWAIDTDPKSQHDAEFLVFVPGGDKGKC